MSFISEDTDFEQFPNMSFQDFSGSLFNNSVDGILVLDTGYRVIAWNRAMEKMSGYTVAEVTGKDIFDLFPVQDENRRKEWFAAVLRGKRIRQHDHPYLVKNNGKKGWADMSFFPLFNQAREISGIVGIVHETTKRKEAELTMQRNEKLYRLLADNSSDLISRHDLEGRFTFVSEVSFKLTGYHPAELLSKLAYDFVHPDDVQLVHQNHHQLLETGEVQMFSFRFLHKKGHYIWLESNSSSIKDPATNRAVEIQIASRDITHRKTTEENLRNKSKLLNGLLSNLPVLVKRVSADGTPHFMQGKALKKLGLEQNRWKEAHLDKEDPEVQEGIRKAMQGESVSLIERHTFQNKPVYFQSYFFPDLEFPGGAIGFSIDITEQKLAEEKLLRNQVFIQKITDSTPFVITIFDFAKGQFVYTNKQIPEVLGYTLDEIQHLGPAVFMKIVHPDDLMELASYIHRVACAPDGEILTIEMRVRDKKGQWRWFMSRSSVFARDELGRAVKGLSVTQDIDQVRRDKDLLSGVLDNSPNGIMALVAIRDEDEKIVDFEWTLVNATSTQLTGRAPASLVGKRILSEMPETETWGLFKRYVEVVETGRPLSLEQYYETDASPRWQFISAVKMEDGLIITFTDITEAKLAREKIQKSEAMLSEAQKIAHLGIWEWDTKNNILTWSDELYHIFGLDSDKRSITYREFETFVHPDDLNNVREAIAVSLQNLMPFEQQMRIVTPKGAEKIIASRAEVQADENKKPVRMIGTTIDITEVMHMRKELENTEQLRQIGEAIPQFVWTTRADGQNEYINHRWYEYTGLDPDPKGFWNWEAVIHPDDLESLQEKWQHSLQTGELLETEFRVRKHDGTYRWHLVRTVPMTDENGHLLKWFGTATDIQDQKQIEQQLRQTQFILSDYNEVLNLKNAQLEKINADLDNFIYTASHDLKAPIHNIEGLIEVLTTEITEKSPVVTSVIEMIQKSINRFKSTVLDLTEISKVERSMKEEDTEINLPALLDEITSDIAPLLIDSKAQIDTDFDVPNLLFSRKNLRSVLYNLLSNALKYRSPDRQLKVKISTRFGPANKVQLVVTDNGLGIDERSQTKVFEMFKRVHTHVEGTGIGLYIVKRIIENAGGDIELTSTPGKGTMFTISLPADTASLV